MRRCSSSPAVPTAAGRNTPRTRAGQAARVPLARPLHLVRLSSIRPGFTRMRTTLKAVMFHSLHHRPSPERGLPALFRGSACDPPGELGRHCRSLNHVVPSLPAWSLNVSAPPIPTEDARLVPGRKHWRRRWDLNPRKARTFAGFQDRCIQPLCHSSFGAVLSSAGRAVQPGLTRPLSRRRPCGYTGGGPRRGAKWCSGGTVAGSGPWP
jgi:hypothetical protein